MNKKLKEELAKLKDELAEAKAVTEREVSLRDGEYSVAYKQTFGLREVPQIPFSIFLKGKSCISFE